MGSFVIPGDNYMNPYPVMIRTILASLEDACCSIYKLNTLALEWIGDFPKEHSRR